MSNKNKIAFANLRAEMSRKQILIQDIGEAIGTTRDTASRKLSRESQITLSEAYIIQNKFFADSDLNYLFSELIDNIKKAS